MKTIINNVISKFSILICLLMLSLTGNAQVAGTHYTVGLANITSTSNNIEFDLMMTVDGPSEGTRFSGITSGINFNSSILNGGTVSLTYLGQRDNAVNGIVINTLNTATVGHIRIVGSPLTPATSIDVPVGSYRIGRYRLTNTVSWAENSNAQFWFQPTVATGKSNNIVNACPIGQTSGGAYAYTTTAPVATPGVGFGSVTQASSINHYLNASCGITSQPVNPVICKQIGATASISVTASGASGATFQWYTQTATGTTWTAVANNTNYSGATTPTLTLTRTSTSVPATGTKYRVIINGGICSNLTSNTVALQEFTLAKIAAVSAKSFANASLSPANTTCQGTSVNLALAAGSIGNIQWQSSTDGINFTNFGSVVTQTAVSAINPAYAINSGNLTADTWFRVAATNGGCNPINSIALKITVSSPAVAGTITGGDVTVCAYVASGTPLDLAGNPIALPFTNSTVLTLNGSFGTILWQKSINYTSATPTWTSALSTTNTLTATNLIADTWYRAIVTNGACKETTPVVKITVSKTAKAGKITATTNNVVTTSVCAGGDITFTSAAYVGTSIKWEVSTISALEGFAPVSGATGLEFTMNDIAYAPLSKFYVRNVVTSGSCTISRSVVKTILVNPLSVPGTVKGGGTICSGSTGTLSASGYTGTVRWEYSTNGSDYFDAPYWKTIAGVPTFVNPNNTTIFTTAASTGIAATYIASNITANVYFRARITSGACSSVYSNAVQYVIGSTAVAGTISPASTTLCPGNGTILTLTGSVGAIQWQKATIAVATGLPGAFANIAGQTSPTLSTGNLTASTAYQALVTIGTCSPTVTASYVSVNVVAKPVSKTITANVTSPTGAVTAPLCTTSTAKVLTIGAGSTGAIQWQMSTTSTTEGFADIAGQTGLTYTIANPAAGANYYRASFTNTCGVVVYSAAVTVYYTVCKTNTTIEAAVETATEEQVAKIPFAVVAYPNPYSSSFNLTLTTSSEEKVGIMVYDMTGRMVDQREVSPANIAELQVGDRYPSGIYNVIITQGSDVKTLRVVKR